MTGHTKQPKETNSQTFSFMLPADLYQRIMKRSERFGISAAAVVRDILEENIPRRGRPRDTKKQRLHA